MEAYATCLLDVNMERLRVVNPTVYEWINRNESVAVDFKNEFDERMYKAIVNDANKGITGCIRAVPYKQIEVSKEAISGLSDIAMMCSAAKFM